MPSLADLEYAYLATKGATGPTLPDRRVQVYIPDIFSYFAGLSGLTPQRSYSLADHRLQYYCSQMGLSSGSLADAMFAFFSNPPGGGSTLYPNVTLFPATNLFPQP